MSADNHNGDGVDEDVEKNVGDRNDKSHRRRKISGDSTQRSPVSTTTQAETQGIRMVAETAPAVAAAGAVSPSHSVDAAVPDRESAFMDMRDPMVSADGHRPNRKEIIRLTLGFTLSAVACAIPWVALSSLILPQLLDQIDPGTREAMIGTINAVGSVVALFANVVFGTLSDLTRSRFGRRSPWIIAGGLLTGLCIFGIGFTTSQTMILLLWCTAQLGYNMMLAPFVATMSDRVPDKVRGTVSGFYGAGIAVGQTLGSLVGSQLIGHIQGGFFMGAAVFAVIGMVTVVVWPRERSSVNMVRKPFSVKMLLLSFQPPKNAPDFYYALFGRTLMMAGYNMVTMYQLYIVKYYVLKDSGFNESDLAAHAATIIATMSIITLVVSLVAALVAGPISDRLGMRKVPISLSSCLFAVGVAMPWILPNALGMYLFAGIAGFGYGVYNAIDQALNVAVLPNPEEAGKDLGILNLANTLCTVLGSMLASGVVLMSGRNYMWIFPTAIVVVLMAAVLIMRIKHVK
ncbi:MAG: MFS transporter [Bifidobacterium crudilactis]|nr:MFS transporter [Bifidobacterium crudilactis]